ncbi:hypothetical protein [Arenibacter sp. F20364]|uniref:hypothetical protein n=1 Tax=Arenibacter sp. F20364 TaxID=2926415 RepID=UPI001FF44F5B|nr:hypothetical protein [Arenibacter sp. F20364]MCK0191401.1 hypothetical protein [Arenibacter sp. F20364]
MEASEILLENVKEEVPSILMKKFETFQIRSLQDVVSIDLNKFSQNRGIGRAVIDQLAQFQLDIINNVDHYTDLQLQNTKTHLLPLDETVVATSNILDLISEILTDYLNLLPKDEHRGIINHLYGLKGSDIFDLDDLSHYYPLSKERIRQIRHYQLQEIRSLFYGNYISSLRCEIRPELVEAFSNLQKHIASKRVFAFNELVETFKDNYACENASSHSALINFLIDLWQFSKCGKVESIFTNADLIVVDESNRGSFIKAADRTIRMLKKKIIPQNKMQAIIEIKKSNRSLQNANILDALNVLPEIEILESNDQTFYQIKFEHLSSAADRAYRILLENGDPMYIDDIVSEINHRLAHTSTSKIYDRHSLAIAADSRFVSMAKTGFWTLKGWKGNTERLEDLIKNALHRLNKPSTYEEIYGLIKSERPNIKEKSVRAITGRDCLKVEGNKWILPEWKQKYSDLAFVKRKKRVVTSEPEYKTEQRAQLIRYLDNKDGNKELASKIIKDLSPLDRHYTKVSFYKLFEQEEYFVKDDQSKLTISLRNQESNVKISIDQYNWKEVSVKLNRDIVGAFSDHTSPNYTNSLQETIQLFYEFILLETNESEFKALPERILGNMKKYYFDSTDNIDKLNFLKQFLTSTDPLFKKVLFIVNQADYSWIKTHKKGLGDIIEKLNKLDPTRERYKDARTARAFKFGKQIQSVYFYRNNDTHGANDWTVAELTKTITDCFTLYIFACAEYYSELKHEITQHNNS